MDSMSRIIVFACLLAVTFVETKGPASRKETDCVCFEDIPSLRGLRNPTSLVHANDGSRRRFVSEQVGIVWVLTPDDEKLPEPFLNISDIILINDNRYDERGFLGLRFHPQHAENRKLYIYYSVSIDGQQSTRLAEIMTFANDNNRADPESSRTLLELEQPFSNHNGGDIVFDDDGLMYFYTGDGGSAGDPFNFAQDKTSLLGKALRIDIDRTEGDKPYGIPPDNPYLDDPEALPELYAIGLRNPWRVTFDRGDQESGVGRGRQFIGDVGQNAWEEVDILEAGGNYAWSAREGPACYKPALCGNIGPEVWPIHSYNHTHTGRCVIGGFIYRGCMNPDMRGWYFFGDYVNGKLFRLVEDEDGSWPARDVHTCAPQVCADAGLTDDYDKSILSYGEDEDGEIFMLMTKTPFGGPPNLPEGSVMKVVDPNNRQPPCQPWKPKY